jgi:hypothetical protein
MNTKKQPNKAKLTLERETLVVLQSSELDRVGGGLVTTGGGAATAAGTLVSKNCAAGFGEFA